MRASLPKQHGFQPSGCNQWQYAGVGWVLPPLVSLEYLALVEVGAEACPVWLEQSWGLSSILPFPLVFLTSSVLTAVWSTLVKKKTRKSSLASDLGCFLHCPTPLFRDKIEKKKGGGGVKGMSLKNPKLPHKNYYLCRKP